MIDILPILDIDSLVRWRKIVIESVFGHAPDFDLIDENRRYFLEHIEDGTYFPLTAFYDEDEAGCAAACFYDELPSPDNSEGRCAKIMNVYVKPQYRGIGIARRMISLLVEEAGKRHCGKICLETTEEGRPIYKALGFAPMGDMMVYLRTQSDPAITSDKTTG